MSQIYNDWQEWLLQNLYLLCKRYGKNNVFLNGNTWQSILILYYKLPSSWKQQTTRLLIVLPPKSQVFYSPPDRFYIDKGLRAVNGKRPNHYYEQNYYNDLSGQGYARFSFHLTDGWHPKKQCHEGTTLLDVIDVFHAGLDIGAKEVMK